MYIPVKVHASLDPVMEGPHLVVYAVDVGFLFRFVFVFVFFPLQRALRLVLLQVCMSFLVYYPCINSKMPAESL